MKGKLKRETESLLLATQNNAIRTNYVKVKIDKIQQISKCRSCGERDLTIHHRIIEFSKLAQKEYKTKHDCREGDPVVYSYADSCKTQRHTIKTSGTVF